MSNVPEPDEVSEEVVVYTTAWCGYCIAARRLFQKLGIPFLDVDVSGNPEARAWLKRSSGQHTVPQIFLRGQSVGGFVELLALSRSGELEPFIG